ncbi:hypothetical protein GCM10010965_29800 [Caldalkalibacillus thermarum]|uniref:A24 family peptidase n=1 Tax=Caldalkalibacillus thermarum TaxID=296745 RepID=UPI001667CB59|nr:A24 family peptidase [Caldalkalibacillus thermarum]GGK34897.1 hypothetical protein GCM10010965_29800 [Caldalkalibacillus thermarum]
MAVIVAVITDLEKMIIPNWLTYPLFVSAIVFKTIDGGMTGLWQAVVAGFLSGLLFFIPAWFNQVGMGDVKLMAGIGAWTSFGVVLLSFVVASIFGFIITLSVLVYKLLVKKRSYREVRTEPIPYAPALGMGVMVVLWWPYF